MSEEKKEWKVGDYCFHHDSYYHLNGDTVRVPCKIISFSETNSSVLQMRSLIGIPFSHNTDRPNNDTICECSQEEFSAFANQIKEEHDEEIQRVEEILTTKRNARLKALEHLQRLGVKVP